MVVKRCLPDFAAKYIAHFYRGLAAIYHRCRSKMKTAYVCSAVALWRRRRRLSCLMRSGSRVRVVFQITSIAKWKYGSVLSALLQKPGVEVMVWFVPILPMLPEEERWYTVDAIRAHFELMNVRVVEYVDANHFPEEEKPDIIFLHEAYDYCFHQPYNRGILKYLLCFVPYCYRNTTAPYSYNGIGNRYAVYNFYENEYMASLAASCSRNRGRNICVTGQPIADAFLFPEKPFAPAWKDCGKPLKKVIWAPHWTISEDLCWFARGTFLRTAEIMLEMAEKYADRIQFAFKPHPHLHRKLCERADWGKEKTDAFFRRWAEMPNTQLETGEYVALFMQSDAMIHDSGSFRLEYLFADKPCMYLREGEGKEDYNQMSQDALTCYQIGITREDIETFLQKSVLGGEDPLAARRAEIRARYLIPPHGKSAAQNIVDALFNS